MNDSPPYNERPSNVITYTPRDTINATFQNISNVSSLLIYKCLKKGASRFSSQNRIDKGNLLFWTSNAPPEFLDIGCGVAELNIKL